MLCTALVGLTVLALAPALASARSAAKATSHATTAPCEWSVELNGLSGLGLDTQADYYVAEITPAAGETQVFTAPYPSARYFSYTLYTFVKILQFGETIPGAHLYDAEIAPSSGVNRYLTGETGSGSYHVTVVDGTAPPKPAANTIYTDTTSSAATLYIMYRVYDSSVAGDPLGGAALPSETTYRNGVAISQGAPCVPPYQSIRRSPATRRSAHRVNRPLSSTGSGLWTLPDPSTAQAQFSNPDISYLAATFPSSDGQVAVVRLKVPAFADTNAGQPAWQFGAQVRYWSVCADNGFFTFVSGCVDDAQAVQSGGYATYAFSLATQRPPNATAADGVNWIGLGSGDYHAIVYRQLLASSTFAQAIAKIPAGGSPATTMGPYLPALSFCSTATFTALGPAGCLGAA